MKYPRLLLSAALLFVAALATGAAFAAEAVKDKEYTVIDPPQPVSSGAKVEVLEFFFYGCPHCHALQPALRAWAKTMPKIGMVACSTAARPEETCNSPQKSSP